MITLLHGDCLTSMQALPDQSVHCCVTSPPYYGLRDYGHADQAGTEATPEAYVANMVKVFQEVKRVLRDDGTLWLNIGDSYATGSGGNNTNSAKQQSNKGTSIAPRKATKYADLKSKDLIGVPWMLAFALRADGWYLRQDIIWSKNNCMPESVKDRCTRAHEYIFLFSKKPKYYFDSTAMQEPEVMKPQKRLTNRKDNPDSKIHGMPVYRQMEGGTGGGTRNKRSVWTVNTKPYKGSHFAVFPPELITPCVLAGCPPDGTVIDPFGGSGTVAGVAVKYNRKAIICELNADYHDLMPARIKQISGYDINELFLETPPTPAYDPDEDFA